jgi:hypothetical protein
MAKTASTIQIRDTHRREYQRDMRRIVVGSIILWFILAIWLGNSFGAEAVFVMSIILSVGLIVARVARWMSYRRDLRVELASQQSPE